MEKKQKNNFFHGKNDNKKAFKTLMPVYFKH